MAKKITNYHCRLLAFIMSQVIVLNYLLLLTKPTTESISTRPQLNKRDDHTLHHTHNTSTFPIDIIIKWDDSISNHNQQQIKLGWLGMYQYYLKDTFTFVKDIPVNYTRTKNEVLLYNNHSHLSFIHGHEFCKYTEPIYRDLSRYSTFIAYNYWNAHRNTLWWERVRNKILPKPVYMPLFFRGDFGDFETETYQLIYDYTTHPGKEYNHRQYLMSAVVVMHTDYRVGYKYIYQNIRYAAEYSHTYNVFLHRPKVWSAVNTRRKYLNRTQYKNILLDSKFTHVPFGNNPETYRLWEALACSAIPIVAVNARYYETFSCKSPFHGFLHYKNETVNAGVDPYYVFDYDQQFGPWNISKPWYVEGLNVRTLDRIYRKDEWIPLIFIKTEMDLQPFLNWVKAQENEDKNKSYTFWNRFQFYSNQWLKEIIHFKMEQFREAVLTGFETKQYTSPNTVVKTPRNSYI
eukprot:811794_1